MDTLTNEAASSTWKTLYKVAGTSALTILLLIPIQITVFLVWPLPDTVTGWFTLFQHNWLVGLLDMDLLLIVDYVLTGLVFLALWAVLRQINQSLMTIALVLEMVAITTYFASTVAFEMLSLSNQYTLATTDPERSTLLAAGQAMLAVWQGTAFDVSCVLSGIAMLITSTVMLRSEVFSKATAWMSVLMGVTGIVPPTAGSLGLVLSLIYLVPFMIWLILVARRLFELGRREQIAMPRQVAELVRIESRTHTDQHAA